MNRIHHLTSMQDLGNLSRQSNGKLIVIDCHAQWCGPCKMIAPEFEQMATQYSNVVFAKVDIDEAEELADQFRISAVPTFILFQDNRVVDRFTGGDMNQLRNLIHKYT